MNDGASVSVRGGPAEEVVEADWQETNCHWQRKVRVPVQWMHSYLMHEIVSKEKWRVLPVKNDSETHSHFLPILDTRSSNAGFNHTRTRSTRGERFLHSSNDWQRHKMQVFIYISIMCVPNILITLFRVASGEDTEVHEASRAGSRDCSIFLKTAQCWQRQHLYDRYRERWWHSG